MQAGKDDFVKITLYSRLQTGIAVHSPPNKTDYTQGKFCPDYSVRHYGETTLISGLRAG